MPKKLLLADDSITIQKVVAITFASEDYAITAVDNGEDAVAKARELLPDVVLADVVMPKRNGYEVCEAIKSDPALQHIPVLLLAGTFEAFDEGRARAAMADGHIQKPFESQALIDRVNKLVGLPASAPMPSLLRPVLGAQPVAQAPVPAAPAPAAIASAAPVAAPRPAVPGPVAPPGMRPPVPGPAPLTPRPPVPGP
ncbi:MAG TPA: hypothetical protein DFS52_28260, partial [Myxococcales bacterium]|nr:hypothetical protein [Myxococcales bacterium]